MLRTWCGVAHLVARRLAVRQACVQFSARNHREVFPTEHTSDEEMERGLIKNMKNKKRVASCHQTLKKDVKNNVQRVVTGKCSTCGASPTRNQWGLQIRWPSANTASQRGGTPLLSPLPHPVSSVNCMVPPPRNQWGPLTRWTSTNTTSQRGGTLLLSPLPHPVCSVICT